jgi:hypothetical protein
MLALRNTSPKFSIGTAPRFTGSVRNEIKVPISHIADPQKVQAKKPKMGVIGTAARLHKGSFSHRNLIVCKT